MGLISLKNTKTGTMHLKYCESTIRNAPQIN